MISAPGPRTEGMFTHPGQSVMVAVVVTCAVMVAATARDAIFPQVTTGSIAIDHIE
jgi:hypothetical protein